VPPTPKPAARRQRRNKRGLELVDVSAAPAQEVPKPPSGLLKKTRQRWAAFWASDVAKVLAVDTDMSGVVRLFQLYDERDRCYGAVRKDRLVEGSRNQPVLNPLYRQLATLDSEIRQLEDRFGLTPMSRLKLGINVGRGRKTIEEMNASLDDHDPDEDSGVDERLAAVEQPAQDA
jgi:P27 family predicted phage terminase small subunit